MRWIWRCSSFALFSLSLLLSVSHSLSHFPPFDPWPLFFLAGYTVHIPASSRPTAPCQYHPSGTTSHSLHCSPKNECQYRPCGNPPCHQCWGPCWSWTIPEAHAYDHTDGTFWTAPNHLDMATSTMQTSSTPSLGASVEPRPSTQEPHPDYCSDLRSVSCGYPTRSQCSCAPKSRTNSSRTQVTDLAILLHRDTFEPNAAVCF